MTLLNEVFINIPRFHTAIAEWLFCVVFILFLEKRFKGIALYGLLLGWLGVFIGYQKLAGMMPIELWIPFMIGAVVLMYVFIAFVTTIPLFTAGFVALQAFIVAEFAASLEWQIYYFVFTNRALSYPVVIEYLIMILIYAIVFLTLLLMESRYKVRKFKLFTTKTDLLTAIGITVIIFAMSNISFADINTPITGRYPAEIFYIRTLVDMLGIILFYAIREYKLTTYARMEINAMESILNKQYSQYRQSQESIDIINRRYHDLKHQIAVIRAESDPEVRAKYLAELEEDIRLYDTQYKTGNKVLDTLLSSKALQIVDNDINFTVVADGSLLNFISVMDLCSIFGNALDNAIEGVKDIKNKEERLIKLAVFKQQNLILIRLENYYKSRLIYDGSTLQTTKKDGRLHGYGLKSIKATAERYDGTVRINTDNNWFTLLILLPNRNNKQQVMTKND